MKFSLSDRSPSVCFEDLVHRTFQALARVPDFRKARGRQFDLSGVLALIIVGLSSGHHSFAAVAAFGKRREDDLIPMLGLPRAPSHKTVWRLAKGVSPEAMREVLREIGGEATSGLFDMAVAVDGKCIGRSGGRGHGGRALDGDRPGRRGRPARRVREDCRPKDDPQTRQVPEDRRIHRRRAVYRQAHRASRGGRGQALRPQAKRGNQPDLYDDVKLCFEDPDAPIVGRSRSSEKGHGRTTRRDCRTSQLLHGYTDFPGLRQAVEEKRRVKKNSTGKVTHETAYAVTSIPPSEASTLTCKKIMRRHWMVENRNNFVRDDSWREDRQVWRRGRTAYVMSILLSIALNLLRAESPHWRDATPLTERAKIMNDLTMTPGKLFRRAS